jgi:hypothetical protein
MQQLPSLRYSCSCFGILMSILAAVPLVKIKLCDLAIKNIDRQVLHFCMWNFVWADKAD